MFKQVIVVNKRLDMSPGKLAAMVAHGATAFMCEWFKNKVSNIEDVSNSNYLIEKHATFDKELFDNWISRGFTKIILEVDDETKMKEIIEKAHSVGMVNKKDFFNIVDESTEFLDVPQWAVIAFRPMEANTIDTITGRLKLYSHNKYTIKSSETAQDEERYCLSGVKNPRKLKYIRE